jgi:hypothetical protein
MGVNRDTWKAEFTADSRLVWPCPACRASPLRIVAKSLIHGETHSSAVAYGEEWWEPDHIDGRFGCAMDCGNCKNVVVATGTFRVQDDHYVDERIGEAGDYENYYRPRFFTDSPHLVDIPEKTPDGVVDELLASFQLYWNDPLACTNRIRSSVEKLLTAERIPQTAGRKTGSKRQFLTLHRRIELFHAKQPKIAGALMAVKWIGNAGSHSRIVTQDDALDGYQLLDWVLDSLYAQRHRTASTLTREINRRRAPRSRRRGPSR